MRVLLVGNYAPDGQRSMLGFVDALAGALPERGVEVRRISAPPRLLGSRAPGGGLGKWLGYLDKFVLFAPALRRAAREADLVHLCDGGNGILVRYLRPFRLLMNCHDLNAIHAARGETPGEGVGRAGRLFQSLNLEALREAPDVVCISETTLADLATLVPRAPGRTHMIHFGLIDHPPEMGDAEAAAILARQGIAPDARFLFHIGLDAPYKNRAGVVRIFTALKRLPGGEDLRLVLAGPPHRAETQRLIDESGVADAIHVLVDVDLETKTALYRRAVALLFPSLSEGFGIPIIEGQTLGCPVITSDRPPMTEIAGGAAILVDPADERGAARRIAESLDRLPELAQRGLRNAEGYTLARMADQYVELYKRLLERTP